MTTTRGNRRGRPRTDPQLLEAALELVRSGLGIEQTSDHLGIGERTINRVLRSRGMRGRGRSAGQRRRHADPR